MNTKSPNGCWTAQERRVSFEAIVLRGLWLLIKATGSAKAREWRGEAIMYLDQVGNQNPEARDFRRNETFSD